MALSLNEIYEAANKVKDNSRKPYGHVEFVQSPKKFKSVLSVAKLVRIEDSKNVDAYSLLFLVQRPYLQLFRQWVEDEYPSPLRIEVEGNNSSTDVYVMVEYQSEDIDSEMLIEYNEALCQMIIQYDDNHPVVIHSPSLDSLSSTATTTAPSFKPKSIASAPVTYPPVQPLSSLIEKQLPARKINGEVEEMKTDIYKKRSFWQRLRESFRTKKTKKSESNNIQEYIPES